jgi:hypothetical protein
VCDDDEAETAEQREAEQLGSDAPPGRVLPAVVLPECARFMHLRT